MHLTIHRGSHEIGGSCVAIETATTRILIDIGEPLSSSSKPIVLDNKPFDALLISHPHQDHYGQMNTISDETPVYAGNISKQLINALATFRGKPLSKKKFIELWKDKPFKVGDIKITPLLVDHSIADAYAFLIEAEGKTILYSGDFRRNGHKGFLFQDVIKKVANKVDVLLMEGTCLKRSNSLFPDEKSVGAKIEDMIKMQTNATLLVCSSSNIDRLVSAHVACKKYGKTLVVDIYTAWILEQLKAISTKTPFVDDKYVKVLAGGYYASGQYIKIKNNKEYDSFKRKIYRSSNVVLLEEIKSHPENYLLKVSPFFTTKLADELLKPNNKMNTIYSMWTGYPLYDELSQLNTINMEYAHTSGHAVLDDLKEFASAIKPKVVVPIHTEHADEFWNHFDSVCEVQDGERFLV